MNKPEFAFQKNIPLQIASGNKFTNNRGFGSRYIYTNYRQKWYRAMVMIPAPPEDWDKERIVRGQIIRIMRPKQKKYDTPNFMHGCKPIPDGLRSLGWIKDDSPKWWNCEYYQITWKEVQEQRSNVKPGALIRIFNF